MNEQDQKDLELMMAIFHSEKLLKLTRWQAKPGKDNRPQQQ